jgi:hypothetical protein
MRRWREACTWLGVERRFEDNSQNRARTMKLVAICRVKNERDIIEPFVLHHCKIFDQLIVLDDGSTDGTFDILQALQAQGLPLVLILDPAVGYEQQRYMTRLLHLAARQYGADWIAPLDADEFVECDSGTTLRQILTGKQPEILRIAWHGFVWAPDQDGTEHNPVLRLRHRIRRWPDHLRKALVPATLVADGVTIAQGNRSLLRAGQEIESRLLDSVRLCHFPIRSVEQYAGKIAVGFLQYMAMPEWDRQMGFHYIEPYRALTENPDGFADIMTVQSRRYCLDPDESDLGEPTEAPLDYLGGPLTLTSMPAPALSNALHCATTIIEKLIESAGQLEAAQRALLAAKDITGEQSERILAQAADARPVVRVPLRRGAGKHTFQSFWSGGALTPFELVCLKSFIDCGHAFDLYSFERDIAVPAGVRLLDAAELFGPDELFVYQDGFGKGSPAAFANVFRYRLLAERGGWWVDTDVVCLASEIPAFREFFAWEDSRLINNAVCYFERGHPMMKASLSEAQRVGRSAKWGEIGPQLLTSIASDLGLTHRAYSSSVCYPIHYSEAIDVLRPAKTESLRHRVGGSLMVHLWSAMLRHHGVDRRMLPPKGSMMREWVDQHPVDGWVGEYESDNLEQLLLPDTDIRMGVSTDLVTGIEDIGRLNTVLRAKLESADGREAVLRAKLESVVAREAQLHTELQSLRNATSWKLTAPVRYTVDWFRRHR